MGTLKSTQARTTGGTELVPPRAEHLVLSLRAVGYSFAAAVADIIDNSITAGARNVHIVPNWSGADSSLRIIDDGHGMDGSTLVEAMRLGSRSPSDARAPGDLGRFGLGLKTASFSQCKSLSVLTRKAGGTPVMRRWDLDHVCQVGEWELLSTARSGSEEQLQLPDDGKPGTVVLWEAMDRITRNAAEGDEQAHRNFLHLMETLEHHLAMVFHRFLGKRLRIQVGRNEVVPWDPFMTGHDATQRFPVEQLGLESARIRISGYVLPHVSRLTNREHREGGGHDGWNERQGFYVYRNDRLLVAGDWLGLGFKKEEHVKLARIAIELPNTVDSEWSIDIKKSVARPPALLKRDLKRVAEAIRRQASEVYRHRGKTLATSTSGHDESVWVRHMKEQRVSYRLDRQHFLIKHLRTATTDRAALDALLRLIEETVPVPTILCDGFERPEQQSQPFEGAPTSEIAAMASALFGVFIKDGYSPQQAAERLMALEPFSHYPQLVQARMEKGTTGTAK